MASATEWQQLRNNTGDSSASLPDVAAEALFVQAATLYSSSAVYAGVRVMRILELLGGAYKKHDYVANNSTESASQIFKNLTTLLGIWQGQAAVGSAADAGSAARFGRTTRKPARIKEHPNDGWQGWG